MFCVAAVFGFSSLFWIVFTCFLPDEIEKSIVFLSVQILMNWLFIKLSTTWAKFCSSSQGQKQSIHVQPPGTHGHQCSLGPTNVSSSTQVWCGRGNWIQLLPSDHFWQIAPLLPPPCSWSAPLQMKAGGYTGSGGLLLTATSPISALRAVAWQSAKINHRCFVLHGDRANGRLWKALTVGKLSVSLT